MCVLCVQVGEKLWENKVRKQKPSGLKVAATAAVVAAATEALSVFRMNKIAAVLPR